MASRLAKPRLLHLHDAAFHGHRMVDYWRRSIAHPKLVEPPGADY